jgi:hypothetical protein
MKTQIVMLAFVLSTSPVFAQSGSRGGDPELIERADIQLFIETKLKTELMFTLQWIERSSLSGGDTALQSQIRKWINEGIYDDIISTSFEFKSECLDEFKRHKGASTPKKRLAPICWSLDFLLAKKPTQSTLAALGYHEFIHHFGEDDTDHLLAAQFKALYLNRLQEISNPPKPEPGSREEDSYRSIQKLLSDNLGLLSLPEKDEQYFYTLCDTGRVGFGGSYEWGDCTALSINHEGYIEYVPIDVWAVGIAGAAAVTMHKDALHRIHGLESLDNVPGTYFVLNSGVGVLGGIRENWFTFKFSYKDFGGRGPELDASYAGFALDFFTLHFLTYSRHEYSKTQWLQLTTRQLNVIR